MCSCRPRSISTTSSSRACSDDGSPRRPTSYELLAAVQLLQGLHDSGVDSGQLPLETQMERHVMEKMKVVILCGGKGTRSYPFTEYFPKVMMPINGTPILVHLMRAYASHGFNY